MGRCERENWNVGGPRRAVEVRKREGDLFLLRSLWQLFVAAPGRQGKTAEDWLRKGLELMTKGSLDESVQAFNKAIEADPQNAEAWRYKALMLRDQGEYDKAIAAFDEAIRLDSQNMEARVEKAGTLMIMGRISEAAIALDAFADKIPVSPEERLWQSDAWRIKGNILVEKGSYEEALKAYDRAIELGSGQPLGSASAMAWLNEGHLLMRMERYEDALLAYDNAAEPDLPPVNSEAWLGKGRALDALSRHYEAVEAYNRSVEAFEIDLIISPEAAKFWKEKADALDGVSRYEEAASAYEKAVQLFRKDIEINAEQSNGWRYWWLGDALLALDRQAEAEAAFARARELGYVE